MLAILYALAVCYQIETPKSSGSDRDLYTSASLAIEANDVTDAVDHLAELIRNFPDSPLARTSVTHLAECYLRQNQAESTIDLLGEWIPRLNDNEPSAALAAQQLLLALEQMPLSYILQPAFFERLLSDNMPDGLKSDLLVATAIRCRQSKDFSEAMTLLRKVDPSSDESRVDRIRRLKFETLLAWAQDDLVRGLPGRSMELLIPLVEEKMLPGQAAPLQLSIDEQVALRFLIVEAYLADNSFAKAETHLEWLKQLAKEQSIAPNWVVTVLLRQAELSVSQGQISKARALIAEARATNQNLKFSAELDFLTARCNIANVEFSAAIESLRKISENLAISDEARARAMWMAGEVYFLQKDLPSAIGSYQRVVALDGRSLWQVGAWLQLGKCYELQGHSAEAIEAYRRVTASNQNAEWTSVANERLGALHSLSLSSSRTSP